MSGITIEAYSPLQISASTAVKTGTGVLGGIFVSAASSTPTVTIYDGTSASGTKIIDTFTPVSGTSYGFSVGFATGCYIAITGTVSLTALYS